MATDFPWTLFAAGLYASIPTAGTVGRFYYATDTEKLYRDSGSAWVETPIYGTSISTFLGLSDSPSSYSGQASKNVRVKADESALEFVAAGAPGAHKTSHQNGGSDEISVAALSGLLADDQHILDAEAQAIKLDDFATPDDNTDLDASAALHGLMPKADKSKLDGLGAYGDVINFIIRRRLITILLNASEASGSGAVPNAIKAITAVGCTGLTKANGFLVIELKASGALTGEGQIEITSSGTWDDHEWHVSTPSGITTSYQTFILPLADAVSHGGELDVSDINFIRWYDVADDGSVTIYWKNARIVYALPIPVGVAGYLQVPKACTISKATLLARETGSIVVDIWKDTYANFPPTDADSIVAAAPPTIAAAQKSQDSTLTGWTKSLTDGDILAFNVDSCAGITELLVSLEVG